MKLVKNIVLSLCVLAILPFGIAQAQSNMGQMQINVYDQNNQPFSGTWYLHQGPNDNGLTIRNGSLGETFLLNEGFYTLVAHGKTYQYPYVVIHSDNPQQVIAGKTAVFNVQYFQTEAQMLNATGEVPAVTTTISEPATTSTKIEFDEFGCNRLEGYAWCEREQKCAKPWYLACKVVKPPVEEVVNEPVVVQPTSLRSSYVSPRSFADVPTFNTAPVTTSSPTVTSATAPTAFELAATGPSAALAMMIGSMMLSGLAIRRKK